jgi:hypothetical protein
MKEEHQTMSIEYKYHHLGIPTQNKVKGMFHVRHLKIYCTDHESNQFGIQWMLYEEGNSLPDLVQKVPHVAFEVNDLQEALKGKRVIVSPNSPSPGVVVAMIEEAGAPVEFLQFEKDIID